MAADTIAGFFTGSVEIVCIFSVGPSEGVEAAGAGTGVTGPGDGLVSNFLVGMEEADSVLSRKSWVVGLVKATGAPTTGLGAVVDGVAVAAGGGGAPGGGVGDFATGGVGCVMTAGFATGEIFEVPWRETFWRDCVISPFPPAFGAGIGAFGVGDTGTGAFGAP
ncbi:MAG: hypothetical protein OHK005_13050 [Candidatus Methylacidiphilales bacterium]